MTITQARVKAMIDKKGEAVSVVVDSVSHDASTNTTTVTPTTYTPVAVCYDFETYLVDGDTVRAGDKKCMIAAKDLKFTPSEAQSITEGGRKYTVLSVETFKVEGVILAYQLHLRAGVSARGRSA